ncbi:MAG: PD-(D/E)XK motif protein [Thermodesulfobacteriota bacterium]|nr:PD-(D/E)XK motif protein [Thermodesulfobacteriota bacterium]
MSLNELSPIEIFEALNAPHEIEGKGEHFIAMPIPSRLGVFIAKDAKRNPALLLSVSDKENLRPLPITLEHIVADHGVECKIQEPDETTHQGVFSIIRCVNAERMLKEYFLRVLMPIIQEMNTKLTYQDISCAVKTLMELFRLINTPGRKTIQGLWAELYLILKASNPDFLAQAWHSTAGDRYDFNAGSERIEVKSTTRSLRIHSFSFEQLNPPDKTKVLIASMCVEEAGIGMSVFDIVDEIRAKLGNNIRLAGRIDEVVASTLGNAWRQAGDVKFDLEVAESSLRFFDSMAVPAIRGNLPEGVSNLRFKADLSHTESIELRGLEGKGELFRALREDA